MVSRAAEIVAAYVTHNSLSPGDLARVLVEVHQSLKSLGIPESDPVAGPALSPAVPIRKSITPDFIICLDDGKKFKSMKRHLSGLGMTPDQYRAKWGLRPDYPMVAPSYSVRRSGLAKSSGLGRTPGPLTGGRRASSGKRSVASES